MSDKKPKVYHNTIFLYCNDVVPIRRFYTDLIKLEETFYRNDDEVGWLTYQSGTLQIVFTRVESHIPVIEDWGLQPSYKEGKLEIPSWVIQVAYEDFDATIERLKAADDVVRLEDSVREARPGHQSFWVRDPMGTTIEVYAVDEESED